MERDFMFLEVEQMIRKKLEMNESVMPTGNPIPKLTPDTVIRDLNMDSLDLTELIIDIEEKYETEIDEGDFQDVVTISDLLDKAEEHLGQVSASDSIENLKNKHNIKE